MHVHRGKRERIIRHEVFLFFVVGDGAVAMYIIHRDNHSQSSSFNKEIEKWVARSYFGNSSFVKALLKMALSSFMALFIFKCGLCINYAKRLVKILAPLFHPT